MQFIESDFLCVCYEKGENFHTIFIYFFLHNSQTPLPVNLPKNSYITFSYLRCELDLEF